MSTKRVGREPTPEMLDGARQHKLDHGLNRRPIPVQLWQAMWDAAPDADAELERRIERALAVPEPCAGQDWQEIWDNMRRVRARLKGDADE
jgi:hypothetical protein